MVKDLFHFAQSYGISAIFSSIVIKCFDVEVVVITLLALFYGVVVELCIFLYLMSLVYVVHPVANLSYFPRSYTLIFFV